nr:PREDICTED: lysophosphatidic acid receptor 6-like [Latimeria chalumnae]|eukprot:XP_014353756.1 PREDICTED: lysophosphatidic acid receptor 6-like [Latimeria chalumnae]
MVTLHYSAKQLEKLHEGSNASATASVISEHDVLKDVFSRPYMAIWKIQYKAKMPRLGPETSSPVNNYKKLWLYSPQQLDKNKMVGYEKHYRDFELKMEAIDAEKLHHEIHYVEASSEDVKIKEEEIACEAQKSYLSTSLLKLPMENMKNNSGLVEMKSTNVTESVQLFQFILYIPTFVLGLVFNTLALWLLLCKIRKWSETTTYMTNLIIFNSFLLFSLPFKILGYKVARWTFGWSFCVFLESLYFVNMYGSILITACITVDRYIAIIHPFLANSIRSPKIALILCFLIWLVVWGGTSHIYQFHEGNNHQNCFHGFSEKMWRNAGLIVLLEVSFLSTAIIMVFCSAWIIIALGNRPELGTEGSKMSKSIAIVLANLVVFLTCFMPYHVGYITYD